MMTKGAPELAARDAQSVAAERIVDAYAAELRRDAVRRYGF
jgi:hypothetical protein